MLVGKKQAACPLAKARSLASLCAVPQRAGKLALLETGKGLN